MAIVTKRCWKSIGSFHKKIKSCQKGVVIIRKGDNIKSQDKSREIIQIINVKRKGDSS